MVLEPGAQPERAPAAPGQGLRPFYMWAGGKTRLIKYYRDVWPVTEGFTSYVEPFFGGGAVFCWMTNEHGHLTGTIGDRNVEVMGLLAEIRDHPRPFLDRVSRLVERYLAIPDHPDRKRWYYELRQAYWNRPGPATLYVLMRLGFNGIWQTCQGSGGLFGTPAGLLRHRVAEQVFDADLITTWSRALSDVTIHAGSYESLELPGRALIYLDPPYRHSFTTYSTGFDDADQEALVAWFIAAADAGHRVLLSNRSPVGDTFFEERLGDVADFHYFDVVYTAGRRKRTDDGFEAKPAREILVVSR